MRKIPIFILSFGMVTAAFSQPVDNSSIDHEDDWETESPTESSSPATAPDNHIRGELVPSTHSFSAEESSTQNPHDSQETPPSRSQEQRHIFIGISLALDVFSENYLVGIDAEPGDEFVDHFGFGGGILFGFDIYRWLTFQTGLNFIFHHGSYALDYWDLGYVYTDEFRKVYNFYAGGIEYYYYLLEVPVQFRFAIPSKTDIVRPFASLSTNIRKPIYASMGEEYAGTFSALDWDIMEYLGFGIEFFRHFAIQYQLLLASIRTNNDKVFGIYDAGTKTWRLSLDIQW